MSKYNSIAVFYGSDSSEWEVSCRSGEFTASRIDGEMYDVYEVFARHGKWQLVSCKKKGAMRMTFPEAARPEIDKTDCSVCVLGEKVRFDYVYIMQHGSPGENGLLQGYLEMLGIPFSSCSAFVSAVAFDKYSCKSYLRDEDYVKCAPDLFVREGADLALFTKKVREQLQFPVFVKPTNGGSSFGVSKVTREEDLAQAIRYAFSEGQTVIVEQGVKGRELTCAAYSVNGVVNALPVIEVVSENDWFDYDAKYNGHSQELCPAPISDEWSARIQQITKKIYHQLGCSGVVRVDYIATEDELFFLEVNTIPGMTSTSLVPKMVRAAGMDMTSFLTQIIENG